jgi:hypothetical protein
MPIAVGHHRYAETDGGALQGAWQAWFEQAGL